LNIKNILYSNFLYGLAILTLSLSVFRLSDYSFSLANFIIIYLFIYYLKLINKYVIFIYFITISYLLLIALYFFQELDILEFIKSFFLTSIMIFVFMSSLSIPIISMKFNLNKIISIIGVLIVSFEMIQVFENILLGSSSTWFLLDSVSISTATDISRFQAMNLLSYMRPISFYHEPSYLGIVLLILLICANELKVKKIFIYIYYLGILVSFSTTALAFLILYLIFKNFNSIKNILIVVFILLILLIFFVGNNTLDTMFRISEIFISGTSGNQRLIGPYEFLFKEIIEKHYYFGIPLGQSDIILDNSFYLIFLYFGILTPILYILFISFIFYRFKSDAFKYLIAFFSLLFLNGAIFTLEATLILYCLNYTFVTKRINLPINKVICI